MGNNTSKSRLQSNKILVNKIILLQHFLGYERQTHWTQTFSMTHNTCNSSKEKEKKWQGKRKTRNKNIAKKNSKKKQQKVHA
jgi:hypothetical protein